MRFKCPKCRASLKPHDLKNDNAKRTKMAEHLRKFVAENSKRKAEEELETDKPKLAKQ